MRCHADRSDGTDRQQRERQAVLSAVHVEAVRSRCYQAGSFCNVAGCVLDRHDVVDLVCQTQDRVGVDLAARPGRNVVEHHGQVGCSCRNGEVLDQPGL